MTEKQFLLAYDRKRTSTLTLDSEPGAHTGTTRQYIPGYSDSNIVFLDTVSGNDANDGSTELLAKLTYASAATAAGSTKKIRVINSGAALSTNITKPTEMKRGVSGAISSSTSAPVDAWTNSATPSFSTSNIKAVCWAEGLSKYFAASESGKIAYSTDGNTWTQVVSTGFGTDTINDIQWNARLKTLIAISGNAVRVSIDGDTWSSVSLYSMPSSEGLSEVLINRDGSAIIIGRGFLYRSSDLGNWGLVTIDTSLVFESCAYSERDDIYVITGQTGIIYYSSNAIAWTLAATPSFGTSNILSVCHSATLGKFVAVGFDGKIAYSTDGNTWTQSSVDPFSGIINKVVWIPEIGKFVASGQSIIGYSSDGDTWTQSATPATGVSIEDIAYSPLLGKAVSVRSAGNIAYSTAFANTISANVAGFTIQAVQYSGTVTAYNCTMKQPGTTANLSLNACRITEAGSHISSNTATSFATLFEGDRHTTCTPAAQNDIDCNLDTVGGTWYIYNASATGYERVRDCLVTDGMIANFNVTVGGRANIQGDSENILIDAEVTLDDPKFVDTTDYKLQFQTNGYPRNSLAAGRSAIYFNSAGDPRDIGAWSYVESAVSYFFAKSAVLYKGQITHATERVTTEQQGDSGVITVFGNKHRVKEILTIEYGPTKELDRAPFEYLDTIDDKGVKLIIDAEWESNAGTVTVNGNQSADSEFLTVDSCIYYNGMWVTVAGKRYWIMRASPSNTAATKLILDRSLEDAVTDNQVLVTNYPPGVGEFQYSGIQQIQLKRIAPDGLVGWQTGFQIRLVRKKQ